jgi:cytoskeleton protein RodZ
MESLGNELKAARTKSKIPLERIADDTRINLSYLRCLEEGRYGELPGGMYNRAFLRAYCEYLGMDSAEFLKRYEIEAGPPSEKVPKVRGKVFEPVSYSQPHPYATWSVLLIATIIGLYLSRGLITSVFSPYFSRPSADRIAHTAFPEPATPSNPQSRSGSGVAQPQTLPLPQTELSAAIAPAPVTSAAAGDLLDSGKTVTPPNETSTPPASLNAIRIEFHAVQKCWASVTSDGHRVFEKTFLPGDNHSFDAAQRLDIVLGNAGGVQLVINGKPAKPLGKSGQVVKVSIDEQTIPSLLEKING